MKKKRVKRNIIFYTYSSHVHNLILNTIEIKNTTNENLFFFQHSALIEWLLHIIDACINVYLFFQHKSINFKQTHTSCVVIDSYFRSTFFFSLSIVFTFHFQVQISCRRYDENELLMAQNNNNRAVLYEHTWQN